MKRLLLPLLSFITLPLTAQTQGDITASSFTDGTHDYDQCMTQGFLSFFVTIDNSFTGDSAKFVTPYDGQTIYALRNDLGADPWIFQTPPLLFGAASDETVTNNLALIPFPPVKIISGSDTLPFWSNAGMVPVPNPCTYADVTGKVYIDANADCVFNAGDEPLHSVSVWNYLNISNTFGTGTLNGSRQTDMAGNYTARLQQTWMTDFSITLPSYYAFIFPPAACSPVTHTFNSLPQSGVDFALRCADVDVSAGVFHSGTVRPAIPFMLYPRAQNEGCDSASGLLKVVLDPDVTFNPALSSTAPDAVSGDTLIWNYSNLSNLGQAGYWNDFRPALHLTPDASVNIGDTLCFRVFASVPGNDIDAANNESRLCVPAVNSYDPNIKEVSPKGSGPEGYISRDVEELAYTIRFQNTGNAPALTVTVTDSLPHNVDAASLRILGSSHTMSPDWAAPGVVNFRFYGISLPDSASNEPASHGFVSFKINRSASVQPGDEIRNKAHIYFDSNPAIITNTALNTIIRPSGVEEQNASGVSVFPNPGKGLYQIRLPQEAVGSGSLSVYTLTGQTVYRTVITQDNLSLDLEQLPAGLYILRTEGTYPTVQRLVKQ